jgi:hypothetical protein
MIYELFGVGTMFIENAAHREHTTKGSFLTPRRIKNYVDLLVMGPHVIEK